MTRWRPGVPTGRVSGVAAPERSSVGVHAAWAQGRAARNGWLNIPDPHLAEVVAARGVLDAITVDLQHGLFDRAGTAAVFRAVAGYGVTPLVRLPAVDEAIVGFVLDAGAAGVIAPLITDVASAEELVAACRYPPKGRRSFGPIRTALRPGDDPLAAADAALAIAMIETGPALEQVDRIAAVDGLDGLFVGPGDLGVALGLGPAQDREEPEMHDAFATVLGACRTHGKRSAIFATGVEYAEARAADGFDLVTVWVDLAAITSSVDATAR